MTNSESLPWQSSLHVSHSVSQALLTAIIADSYQLPNWPSRNYSKTIKLVGFMQSTTQTCCNISRCFQPMLNLKQHSWAERLQSYVWPLNKASHFNQFKTKKNPNTWPEHHHLQQAVANSRQFDFKITTLRTSGNNLPQHKLWMTHLGIRVARVETDLPKGFESLSYGKHYICKPAKRQRWDWGGYSDGNAEPQL